MKKSTTTTRSSSNSLGGEKSKVFVLFGENIEILTLTYLNQI